MLMLFRRQRLVAAEKEADEEEEDIGTALRRSAWWATQTQATPGDGDLAARIGESEPRAAGIGLPMTRRRSAKQPTAAVGLPVAQSWLFGRHGADRRSSRRAATRVGDIGCEAQRWRSRAARDAGLGFVGN